METCKEKILAVLPYKNRKNEGAEDQFQQLSDALNVLTDEKTRAAYDNLLWLTELTNKQIRDRLKVLKTNQEVRKGKVTSEERKIRKNERNEKKQERKTEMRAENVNQVEAKAQDAANSQGSKNKKKKKKKKSKNPEGLYGVRTQVNFVSGGFQSQKKDENEEAEARQVRDDRKIEEGGEIQGFGDWEKHTKGIGAKLLLNMGFQPGKGLGKNLQGRSSIVETCGNGSGNKGIGAAKLKESVRTKKLDEKSKTLSLNCGNVIGKKGIGTDNSQKSVRPNKFGSICTSLL